MMTLLYKNLHMPFSSAELRDIEFVNDIALYLHGDWIIYIKLKWPSLRFIRLLVPIINWNKLMALMVGDEDPQLWKPHQQFEWIPRGTLFPYVGNVICIDLYHLIIKRYPF